MIAGTVRAQVRVDGAASMPYHLGRTLAAALATRAGGLPPGLRRRLSLEGRA